MGVISNPYVKRVGSDIRFKDPSLTEPRIDLKAAGAIVCRAKAGQIITFQNALKAAAQFYHDGSATANIYGSVTSGHVLKFFATSSDAYPFISFTGAGGVYVDLTATYAFQIRDAGTLIGSVAAGGGGAGGVLKLKETTTPSATADFGAIYTKADNHLYWQSGAGVEYDLGGA